MPGQPKYQTVAATLRREIAVKRLTHAQKTALVEENREHTRKMWDEMRK